MELAADKLIGPLTLTCLVTDNTMCTIVWFRQSVFPAHEYTLPVVVTNANRLAVNS